MKYKYNLEIRNETDKDEIFNKYKQIIYDYILGEIDGTFDFNLDLLVVFREIDENNKFINEETMNGGTTIIENKYAIILNIASLEKLPDDGGCDLAISVHHELCHAYDLHYVMHNKLYPVNPLINNYKSFKAFTISKGWGFWTEFHAYYLTYKAFKEEFGCPTYLQIVKGYEKLKEQFEEIKAITDFETEESATLLEDFMDNVDDFIYFTAKYLACSAFVDEEKEIVGENITESASTVRVDEIRYKSIDKLLPLVRKGYGIGSAKKLYKLGKYLLDDIYKEFNLFVINNEGRMMFAYCD